MKQKLMKIAMLFIAIGMFAMAPALATAADLGPAFVAKHDGKYAYVVTVAAFNAAKGQFAKLQAPQTMWWIEEKEMEVSTNGVYYRYITDEAPPMAAAEDLRWNVQIRGKDEANGRWLPFELAGLNKKDKFDLPEGLVIVNLGGNGYDFNMEIVDVDAGTWQSLQ